MAGVPDANASAGKTTNRDGETPVVEETEADATAGESLLADAARELSEQGLADGAITTEHVTSDAPVRTIADALALAVEWGCRHRVL